MSDTIYPYGLSVRAMESAGFDTKRYLHVRFVPMRIPDIQSPVRPIAGTDSVAVLGTAYVQLCSYPIPVKWEDAVPITHSKARFIPGYIVAKHHQVDFAVNEEAFRDHPEVSSKNIGIDLPINPDFTLRRYAKMHKEALDIPIADLTRDTQRPDQLKRVG